MSLCTLMFASSSAAAAAAAAAATDSAFAAAFAAIAGSSEDDNVAVVPSTPPMSPITIPSDTDSDVDDLANDYFTSTVFHMYTPDYDGYEQVDDLIADARAEQRAADDARMAECADQLPRVLILDSDFDKDTDVDSDSDSESDSDDHAAITEAFAAQRRYLESQAERARSLTPIVLAADSDESDVYSQVSSDTFASLTESIELTKQRQAARKERSAKWRRLQALAARYPVARRSTSAPVNHRRSRDEFEEREQQVDEWLQFSRSASPASLADFEADNEMEELSSTSTSTSPATADVETHLPMSEAVALVTKWASANQINMSNFSASAIVDTDATEKGASEHRRKRIVIEIEVNSDDEVQIPCEFIKYNNLRYRSVMCGSVGNEM